MNILQALIQLRDDIKQWATNNLVALDNKIKHLIGDKPVPEQIQEAITSQLPDIKDDKSGELLISDPQGNTVLKVNKDGLHTTDVRVGKTLLSQKIPQWDSKSDFSGDFDDLANKPNITDNGSGDFTIADPYGNAIFKIDAQGAHTTALTLKGHPAATKIEIDGKAEELKKELGNALDSDSSQLRIADSYGNIIFGVDALGVQTTNLRLKGKSVATQEYVDSKTSAFPKIPAWALAETKPVYTKSDVGLDKVNNTSDENKPISKATQQAIDNVKESIGYGIESDGASWLIVDANGYIAFRVDDWGTHVADLIIENKSLKETLASLESRISTLEKEV